MAYTFLSITKIKTEGTMTSKYNHNCRKADVANAIPELSDRNDNLIPLPQRNGEELSYREAFEQRIQELPYYQTHGIRKDQVLGYEVLLTFSKDDGIDIDQWKKQSVDWLHKTFDVAPDGKSNVMHAIFHGDETGNVHIHAFVLPIDERGHLNAKRFTGGVYALSDLQSSYANSMKNLGLQRGLAGSSAHHQDIRRMYADLNNAIRIPEVLPGETVEQYRTRIEDDLKTRYASQKKAADDYAIKQRRGTDRYIAQQREALSDEAEKIRSALTHTTKGLEKKKTQLESDCLKAESELDSYRQMLASLASQMYEIRTALNEEKEQRENAQRYLAQQKGIKVIEATDPALAESIRGNIDYAIQRSSEYDELFAVDDQSIDPDIENTTPEH